MEEWKKHPSLEIEVSNLGRIKTLGKIQKRANGNWHYKPRDIVQFAQYTKKSKSKYYKCHLYVPSAKGHNYWSHRLVAETWLPNPNNHKYVDHIDGNGLNNKPENLEWVDNSTNVLRGVRKGGWGKTIYFNGISRSDIARKLELCNGQQIAKRIKRGWCENCALTIPSKGMGGNRGLTTCLH